MSKELQVGDYFKFEKEKNILKLYGQIIEKDSKNYHFKVLGSNRQGKINKTGIFLINGKVSEFVTKINREEVKEGFFI